MLLDVETIENPVFEFLADGYHKLIIVKCDFIQGENEGFEIEWQQEGTKKKCFSKLLYKVEGNPSWASYSRDGLRDLLWVFNIKKLENPEQAVKLSHWLIGKSCTVKTKQRSYVGRDGDNKITVNTQSFYNENGTNRAGFKATLPTAVPTQAEDVPW
jgi:hypothetical protein